MTNNYNQIHDIKDVTTESGVPDEPVTLQEAKDYMRIEGIGVDNEGVISQAPITLTLANGAFTVQSNLLIAAVILTISREGTVYSVSNVVGNRAVTHNATTGVITFDIAGTPGGNAVDILYGNLVDNASDDAFQFDDALITSMIAAARRKAEKFCGISIVFHQWKVLLDNGAGDQELPNGPVRTFTEMLNCDGTAIVSDSYKLRGFDYQFLESPRDKMLTIQYDAGYLSCPAEIKLAIMQMVAFWYENRGETNERTIPAVALNNLWSFKRPWTYVA